MNPRLSLYLDFLRFAAAFWVVLSHFQAWGFAPPALANIMPESGRDAVVLFFVLSGFVIAHTSARKDGRSYAIDRAARIYSVVVPIVLSTTILALWGAASGATGYERFYEADKILLYLGIYFTFLGSAWSLQEMPFGILPYWSLNFEVWYYVLFGALVYLRGAWRVGVFGAAFLIVGYKVWILWPVWLAGVWLYRNIERRPLRPAAARILFGSTIAAYLAMEASGFGDWLSQIGNLPFGGVEASPLGDARYYLSAYAVGLLGVLNLYAFRYSNLSLPAWSAPSIRWAAGFTFTLYLAHGPLLTFFGIHVSKTDESLGGTLLLLAGLLAAVVLIGYCTERQLGVWRRGLTHVLTATEHVLTPLRRRVATGRVLRWHR